MKFKILVAGAVLLFPQFWGRDLAASCACEAAALSARLPSQGAEFTQSSTSLIAGIWEGKTEGVPAITLTIKDDGNKLSGSVTFYRIENDGNGPTVTGKDTR